MQERQRPESMNNWAIVLAAGAGARLSSLTKQSNGSIVPKQFCSLLGGRTLLEDALARAEGVVPRKRILVVVAEEHRSLWARLLADHPVENTVVQPRNRGTASGILLPLLHVLERDPEARIVLLPSDHHFEQECVVQTSLRLALDALGDVGEGAILLGITPDAPETGYGWIAPLPSGKLVRPVARFVEKPDGARASELMAQGALWNSFLVVADGRSILSLYERRLPGLLQRFRSAFGFAGRKRAARLRELYAGLEVNDFSRHVLEGSEDRLHLLIVPPCGWTDLGTPSRVKACLASVADRAAPVPRRSRQPGQSVPNLSWILAGASDAATASPLFT
jgi:mannose-1-phosphate guanylyltransferase